MTLPSPGTEMLYLASSNSGILKGRGCRAGAGELGGTRPGRTPHPALHSGAAAADRTSTCLMVGHVIAGDGLKEAVRRWWLLRGNAASLASCAVSPDPPFFPEKSEIQIWI